MHGKLEVLGSDAVKSWAFATAVKVKCSPRLIYIRFDPIIASLHALASKVFNL